MHGGPSLATSRLGKGLGGVRVLDLLDGAAPTMAASPAPAQPKPRTKKPKKVRARRRAAKKTKASTSTSTLGKKVLQVLGAAEAPLWRGAIAERIGVDPLSLKNPLQLLVYDGSIVAEGPANRRLYSLPNARATDGAAGLVDPSAVSAPSSAKKRPKRSRAAKRAQKTKKPERRTRARQAGSPKQPSRPPGMSAEKRDELARYGAAVFAALKAAGTWIGSAALRAQTGGTSAQFQRAVKKLEASGDIVRRGTKSLTEFAPAGAQPGT